MVTVSRQNCHMPSSGIFFYLAASKQCINKVNAIFSDIAALNGVWINGIFFYLAARKTVFGQNVFSLTLQLENGVWIKGIFFYLAASKRRLFKWYFI